MWISNEHSPGNADKPSWVSMLDQTIKPYSIPQAGADQSRLSAIQSVKIFISQPRARQRKLHLKD
jgi:hypothetical protein